MLGIKFHLPIGIVLVMLTNPFTIIPIYYLFLMTGNTLLPLFGESPTELSYEFFTNQITIILQKERMIDSIFYGIKFLFVELFQPMFIGSMVFAIPLSIFGWFATKRIVTRYRQKKNTANVNDKKLQVGYDI